MGNYPMGKRISPFSSGKSDLSFFQLKRTTLPPKAGKETRVGLEKGSEEGGVSCWISLGFCGRRDPKTRLAESPPSQNPAITSDDPDAARKRRNHPDPFRVGTHAVPPFRQRPKRSHSTPNPKTPPGNATQASQKPHGAPFPASQQAPLSHRCVSLGASWILP